MLVCHSVNGFSSLVLLKECQQLKYKLDYLVLKHLSKVGMFYKYKYKQCFSNCLKFTYNFLLRNLDCLSKRYADFEVDQHILNKLKH